MKSELEKEDMKLKLANLNHDVSCLIAAFNNAKKTGRFEVGDFEIKIYYFHEFIHFFYSSKTFTSKRSH